MSHPAINFEAKLYALRRSKDGVIVSYVVHPNDVASGLLTADIGTRFMVAVAEIGDDQEVYGGVAESHDAATSGTSAVPAPAITIAAVKERRKFDNLPLSTQAALRCEDKRFQDFLRVRSGVDPTTEGAAAAYVRLHCGVGSRAELDRDQDAGGKWIALDRKFQSHLTDLAHGESVR